MKKLIYILFLGIIISNNLYNDCKGRPYKLILEDVGFARISKVENYQGCSEITLFGEANSLVDNFKINKNDYLGLVIQPNLDKERFFVHEIDKEIGYTKLYVNNKYNGSCGNSKNRIINNIYPQVKINIYDIENYLDGCGICDNNHENHNESCSDCAGIPYGETLIDCAGICGGVSYFDLCGTCDDNVNNDCSYDCNNILGGEAKIDECGICAGGDTGLLFNQYLDCAGECFGKAVLDECGVCNGLGAIYTCGCNNLQEGECDCNGNVLDYCGICGGDNTSCKVGCTDMHALNFDLDAIVDDNSCYYNHEEELSESCLSLQPKPRKGFEIYKFLDYPELAREMQQEGIVVVSALISKKGRVLETRISKGVIPILNEAAEAAVKKSIWTPAMQDCKRVAVWMHLPVQFKLQ